jgi:hypothetical protein
MHNPRSRAILALLVVLAALGWSLAWGFNGQTADGSRSVLGLDEGGWRALLNPALVVALVAALVWAAVGPRSVGALLVVSGLGAMVAGNLLGFGLLGAPTPAASAGEPAFLWGAAVAVAGLALLMGQAAARSTGRAWLGAAASIGTALGVAAISVAAPPAASLALLPLLDAFSRGRREDAARSPIRGLLSSEAQG